MLGHRCLECARRLYYSAGKAATRHSTQTDWYAFSTTHPLY